MSSLISSLTGTGTDNHIVRWDGTSNIQDSLAIISDAGALTGVTQLVVDNLTLDGTTISSSSTINLSGTSGVTIDAGSGQLNMAANLAEVLISSQVGIFLNCHTWIVRDGSGSAVAGELRFVHANLAIDKYVGFKAPSLIASNFVFTLPAALPASTQAFFSSSSGVVSFALVPTYTSTGTDNHIVRWDGTTGVQDSDLQIADTTGQITPSTTNANLLIDGNGTGFVQLNTGSNSQQFPKARPAGAPANGFWLKINTATGLMSWNSFPIVSTDQLQAAYNSTTTEPLFALNASFPFYIYDNATPLATAFKIADSTGATSYFSISSTGATTIRLDVDNIRTDGNTLSSTDTNGNILLSPNGTGTVIVGTSVGENDLLINQLGLMGSGISTNAMINVNTTSTLRNALSFTVISQNTGTSASAFVASTTDQGTNATHTYSSVNASITLDTTSHTTYTQTVLVAAGGTAAARTFSAGTYTFHGLRVRPTVNGTGGTHSGGTVRIYGILQEAIGTYASVGSQLSMGAFFNDSINVPANTKIIWDSTSTVLGDTYHVYNSATTDMDVYVDNTRTFTFDADKNISHTNLKLDTANTGLFLKEGTNCCMGVATLVAGTIVVNTTMAVTGVRIFLSRFTNGGTLGTLSYTITTGTSFTINSSNILDTSVVNWLIVSQA